MLRLLQSIGAIHSLCEVSRNEKRKTSKTTDRGMTVQGAIDLLVKIKEKHGDVDVFFDCQHCGKATQPDVLVAVARVSGKTDPK